MRYLKIFIYLIILSPLCVKGLVCDNTAKVRLQKLAQNITTSYDYVEQNGTVTFNITFLNLNSELYLVDTVNEKDIYYSDTSLTLNGFESGKNYKFKVRSTDPFCSGSVLYYIYVTTPYFNPYYNDPICEGVSYKYCNKWQKNDLSYDEFIENVQNYKKEIIVKPDNPKNTKGIFDYLIDFYVSYYYIVLPIIILSIIIYIVVARKKDSLF